MFFNTFKHTLQLNVFFFFVEIYNFKDASGILAQYTEKPLGNKAFCMTVENQC